MAMGVGRHSRWEGSRADLLLASMAGGTYALILLGIYTAAIGAGLTCDGRWPLCDGAVFGLFPANWPSFVEWFHRLVAMVTGILILGGWAIVWRRGSSRKARAAMTGALVLLPIQIWLGRETVLGYEIIALTAHFLAALVIFTGIVLGVTWHWGLERRIPAMTVSLLAGAFALFIPFVLLTPQFLFVHTGEVQMLYYGLGLVIFVALLLVTIGSRPTAVRGVTGFGLVLLAVQLLAGRLVRTPTMEFLDWGAGAGFIVVIAVALWIAYRDAARHIYAQGRFL